ncbi:hypothetical protein IF188_09620 [Microbacterium sp. NEAU-LLC]|uniref:WxL domain-containing protein n=1 Tax=Microbacterium helvum TaxID=2773713 RepID=A0ABR8NMQ7_9MICO|nr:hypothetical protein [Microbacterium helvum]MBD3941952.1 hypothetical protein [Microbacterium helvum]
MTLVGPCVLIFGDPATGTDYGDFVTNIVQNPPEPIVLPAINRDYSASPSRGYSITLTGVQESLEDGTLWRYLWDNFNKADEPVTWSPLGAGDVFFEAKVASVPDPQVGGAANQHGTFDITLNLVERPTIIANPLVTPPTGVTEGAPGSFTPSGATPPANLAALNALGALGESSTAWALGSYVVLGDNSHAYWNGTTWVAGEAPAP